MNALINLPEIKKTSLSDMLGKSIFYVSVMYEYEDDEIIVHECYAANGKESDILECLNDETITEMQQFLLADYKEQLRDEQARQVA